VHAPRTGAAAAGRRRLVRRPRRRVPRVVAGPPRQGRHRGAGEVKAVVLAAGQGSRLLPLTADRPKPLVPVGGRPLLFRALDRLAEVGVAGPDVLVVAGYRRDVLEAALAAGGFGCVRVLDNPHWSARQDFYSLYVAPAA